jgi:predicted AAA+ superfamily ATPase
MIDKLIKLSQEECRKTLEARLNEKAPGKIQLLTGPRQVGKTDTLLKLAKKFHETAIYTAADSPESALPGYWERLWQSAFEMEKAKGVAILLIDEVQHLPDWSIRLKGEWDKVLREGLKIYLVASGSSSLHLGRGSKESLAGRIERLTITHWSAAMLKKAFKLPKNEAIIRIVTRGSYPGSMVFYNDLQRWSAYIRDAIIDPAISHDIFSLTEVRRPALLKQVFALSAASPAQIVSLNKLQGQLQDKGALDTISHYLSLLEDSFLIAALDKHTAKPIRSRSAPPKLVVLNNALLAVMDQRGIPNKKNDPERFGNWVENAVLAFCWNSGQQVSYWRDDTYEVDGVIDGPWGSFAIEVKTSSFIERDLIGLLEFTRQYPKYAPLVVCDEKDVPRAKKMNLKAVSWQNFLYSGPPKS